MPRPILATTVAADLEWLCERIAIGGLEGLGTTAVAVAFAALSAAQIVDLSKKSLREIGDVVKDAIQAETLRQIGAQLENLIELVNEYNHTKRTASYKLNDADLQAGRLMHESASLGPTGLTVAMLAASVKIAVLQERASRFHEIGELCNIAKVRDFAGETLRACKLKTPQLLTEIVTDPYLDVTDTYKLVPKNIKSLSDAWKDPAGYLRFQFRVREYCGGVRDYYTDVRGEKFWIGCGNAAPKALKVVNDARKGAYATLFRKPEESAARLIRYWGALKGVPDHCT